MMKSQKIKRWLLALLLTIGVATPAVAVSIYQPTTVLAANTDSSNEVVNFENSKFADLVFDNLKAQNVPGITDSKHITQGQMAQLTKITNDTGRESDYHELLNGGNGIPVHNSKINPGNYSIEGIQYAKNITSLNLSMVLNYGHKYYFNDITDISPLKNLTKLTSINLSGNRIQDVSPLQHLDKVTTLKLQYNCITDMSMLNSKQYSDFSIFRQYVYADEISAPNRQAVIKTPFKAWLPQGFTFNPFGVQSNTQNNATIGYALDASPETKQIAFYAPLRNSISQDGSSIEYNNLPTQAPGLTTDPYGYNETTLQIPYKYNMWYVYKDSNYNGSYDIWDVIQPYNLSNKVDYTLTPVDENGNPIKGTTPTKGSVTPGTKVNVPQIDGWAPDTDQVTINKAGNVNVKNTQNNVDYTLTPVDENGKAIPNTKPTKGSGLPGTEVKVPTINGWTPKTSTVKVPTDGGNINVIYTKNATPVNPNPQPTPSQPGSQPDSPNTPSQPSGNQPTTDNPINQPEGNADKPTADVNEAVYSIRPIYLYRHAKFNKQDRIIFYQSKARIDRPMFVVEKIVTNQNGLSRYLVKDVNHKSASHGKQGYITTNWNYVRPVYYQSKHTTLTVINDSGANEYKNKNLTGKVKHFKQGTVLHVKGFVDHNLTTRYKLSNGHYITGNRKLVKMGKVKFAKTVQSKHRIHLYKSANLSKHGVKKNYAANHKFNVIKSAYSHKYDLNQGSALRYKVKGGYITGNSKYTKVIK